MLSDLRLFQLVSPALPIGAFTYSQGLELAVETGWVSSQAQFEEWLTGQLNFSLATLEIPLLARMLDAVEQQDDKALVEQAKTLLAWRETKSCVWKRNSAVPHSRGFCRSWG